MSLAVVWAVVAAEVAPAIVMRVSAGSYPANRLSRRKKVRGRRNRGLFLREQQHALRLWPMCCSASRGRRGACALSGGFAGDLRTFVDHRLIARIGGRNGLLFRAGQTGARALRRKVECWCLLFRRSRSRTHSWLLGCAIQERRYRHGAAHKCDRLWVAYADDHRRSGSLQTCGPAAVVD